MQTPVQQADQDNRRPPVPPENEPLLEVAGVSKHFGAIQALDDVTLSVRRGRVHALCGANGAGKSTLVRILAGAEVPDRGTIRVDGAPVSIRSPQHATGLGLSFIHQDLHLVPKFTALANLALGYPAAQRAGFVDRRSLRRRACEVLAGLGTEVPLDMEIERLGVSDRWTVSLARALMNDARLIAMDEPTVAFTDAEAERLFAVISQLTARGTAVLYISHRLDEVLRISDEISVLRGGRLISSRPAAEHDRENLTHTIVGRAVEAAAAGPHTPARAAETVLRTAALAREPRVRGVDLEIRAGEVMGLAGLAGAGRTELARLLFGLDRPSAGTMMLSGRPYRPRSPFDAIRHGVAMVPEERRSQALLLAESVLFNIALSRTAAVRGGWLSPRRAREAARRVVAAFDITASSVRQPVIELSGGNQQKLVVGRAAAALPRLLILDEPTAGVDAGARAEIYRLISELAAAGTAVLVISSDFGELAICHRVAVMREGRVRAVLDGRLASKERLTSLCYAADEEDT